jgi:hypothetical protein
MYKFIQDLLTEDDNSTWCLARFSTLIGVFTFAIMGIIDACQSHATQFNDFGIGFGALLTGCGIVIAGKAATQKDKND